MSKQERYTIKQVSEITGFTSRHIHGLMKKLEYPEFRVREVKRDKHSMRKRYMVTHHFVQRIQEWKDRGRHIEEKKSDRNMSTLIRLSREALNEIAELEGTDFLSAYDKFIKLLKDSTNESSKEVQPQHNKE